jgi:hypothetical protein
MRVGTLGDGGGVGHVAAFRAAAACGAEVVAAAWAEAHAMTTAGAADGAKTHPREHGEQESGEPERDVDGANPAVMRRLGLIVVREAEERGSVIRIAIHMSCAMRPSVPWRAWVEVRMALSIVDKQPAEVAPDCAA